MVQIGNVYLVDKAVPDELIGNLEKNLQAQYTASVFDLRMKFVRLRLWRFEPASCMLSTCLIACVSASGSTLAGPYWLQQLRKTERYVSFAGPGLNYSHRPGDGSSITRLQNCHLMTRNC